MDNDVDLEGILKAYQEYYRQAKILSNEGRLREFKNNENKFTNKKGLQYYEFDLDLARDDSRGTHRGVILMDNANKIHEGYFSIDHCHTLKRFL